MKSVRANVRCKDAGNIKRIINFPARTRDAWKAGIDIRSSSIQPANICFPRNSSALINHRNTLHLRGPRRSCSFFPRSIATTSLRCMDNRRIDRAMHHGANGRYASWFTRARVADINDTVSATERWGELGAQRTPDGPRRTYDGPVYAVTPHPDPRSRDPNRAIVSRKSTRVSCVIFATPTCVDDRERSWKHTQFARDATSLLHLPVRGP